MRVRVLNTCLFICACWILAPLTVFAQAKGVVVTEADDGPGHRLALVIGNQNYPRGPLKNTLNDAAAIKRALEDVGFAVDHKEDTSLRDLGRAIDSFTAKLKPNDIALFYFSGHGIQIEGRNYILPLDFAAESEADVEYVAYAADRVQRKMEERGTRLNILILDACRDNPYRFGKSVGRGLAPMAEGVGTVIAFAAKEGQIASDNPAGDNGLFTQYLLEELRKPGVEIRKLFVDVQRKVYLSSGKKQFPYIYSGVVNDFFFRPPVMQGTIKYHLYNLEDNSDAGGELTITVIADNVLIVRGTGGTGNMGLLGAEWTGDGKLDNREGYYDWEFPVREDGKKYQSGRTTFTVLPDGTLNGHVLGSGLRPEIDWRYLARPITAH